MNSALNAAGTAALNALLGTQAEAGGQWHAGMQKRSFAEAVGDYEEGRDYGQGEDGLNQGPSKFARPATDFRGKGWVCGKCGNNNHDGRQVCNMRFCQAPRPMQLGEWLCTCGNVNYATRTVCGLRKCQLPRPNDPQIEQIISSVMGQVGVGNGAAQHFPAPAAPRAGAGQGGLPQPPEGSWMCMACGNVNWPTRDTCNGRSCGLPRAEVDGGPYQPPQAVPAAPMAAVHHMQPPQQQAVPEGSWSCVACGNINWPTRDTCNKRSCGRPRSEVDGGQPAAPAPYAARPAGAQATPPEGSWVCIACNNINWPTRDTCNKRMCGKPRAEVDGGPPLAGSFA